GKLLRHDRLWSVAERMVGIVMHFDNQSVGANSHSGPRHGKHFVPLARSVTWIDKNRQMTEPLHGRYKAEIERVSRVIGKGSDPSLTKHNVIVAFAHHVLGSHEQLFQRGRHASLEQYRLASATCTLKKLEV